MNSFIDHISARAFFRAPADGPAGTLGKGVVYHDTFGDGAVAGDLLEDGVAPSFQSLAALIADTTVTPGASLGARVRLEEHSAGGVTPVLLEAVSGADPDVIGASAGGAVNWRVTGPEADVRMWGAMGDGVADDRAAIQAAEDACANLAAERGGRMTLRFPAGTYAIGDTVVKRAGVDWRMAGELRRADADAPTPSGTQYSLVLAENVDGWSIVGGVFRAITHRKVEAAGLLRKNNNADPGNTNACIHVSNCKEWAIRDSVFRDYSQGIVYQGCSAFRIESNEMEDGSGETIQSMLDGTYSLPYAYSGTGAIMHATIASGPPPVSSNFIISGNIIRNPGLDIAIQALNQAYDAQPGMVSRNMIFGSRAGTQVYRGTFPDPGDLRGAPADRGQLYLRNVGAGRLSAMHHRRALRREHHPLSRAGGHQRRRLLRRGDRDAGQSVQRLSLGGAAFRQGRYRDRRQCHPECRPARGRFGRRDPGAHPQHARSRQSDRARRQGVHGARRRGDRGGGRRADRTLCGRRQ
jgi:hypothetical protein